MKLSSAIAMLDFTSALYLGMSHPSSSLRPWSQLTIGAPAALAPPPGAEQVAHRIAHLQGCERGALGASSLHLFWDLFGMLARRPVTIFFDAGLYPIGRWGVERAAARGASVHRFGHHDVKGLRGQLGRLADGSARPFVVTDGFCPDCGRMAPLPAYLEAVRELRGRLIVDDTQALGIFGHSRSREAPYGRLGGGSLKWFGISGPDVLAICSLAKGFGVPLAVLSGSQAEVRKFEAGSETRVHCSPPSVAAIRAAEHALEVNVMSGDRLRLRLARSVAHFRRGAEKAGFQFTGGLFPVQTLAPQSRAETISIRKHLLDRGVRTVLRQASEGKGLRISFVITARHTADAIDRAVKALADV
jgi:8-amino-7-oxononanoate synthase